MKNLLLLSFFLLSLTGDNDVPVYTKAEILGDVNIASHPEFTKLQSIHTTKPAAYLRTEVYEAFQEMWQTAQDDGINLIIISATRNRSYQAGIWNRKWNTYGGSEDDRAQRILEYSSMPGTSRHHWGTDFDLNALNNEYFESGPGLEIYNWLQAHAHKYGFFQPYTRFNDFRDAGYREEKWHWSYYPLASRFQRAYNHIVDYDDIKGFNGSEYARKMDVINNYVNGVEVPEKVLKKHWF